MIKAFVKATVILGDSDGKTTRLNFSELEKLVYEVEKREVESKHGTRCYEPTGRRTISIFGTVDE